MAGKAAEMSNDDLIRYLQSMREKKQGTDPADADRSSPPAGAGRRKNHAENCRRRKKLVKILAGRARRHTLTPEQISRAMDEQEYDVSGLDALYAALEARSIRVTEERSGHAHAG